MPLPDERPTSVHSLSHHVNSLVSGMQAFCQKKGPGGMPPGHFFAGFGRGLADRRGVLQAALVPQAVHAARDLERRALPDVLLEHLAVIPDVLDDAVGPVLGKTELLAVIAFGAEQALH